MNYFAQINNHMIDENYRRRENELTLRNGQIVQGRILKLYPNNRAEIQISSQKLIAEIRRSLQIGKQYFFQVQTDESLLQLKVLSEPSRQGETDPFAFLLQKLNVKATRLNISFIQQLLKEQIPFEPAQVQQAFALMSRIAPVDQEQIDIVKRMIALRLPVTKNVFAALLARKEQSFSSHIQEMLQRLKNASSLTKLEENLLYSLQEVTNNRKTFINEFIESIQNKQTSIATFWKGISLSVTRVDKQADEFQLLQSFMLEKENISSSTMNNQVFYSIIKKMRQVFTDLLREQPSIQTASSNLLQTFPSFHSGNIRDQQFVLLKNRMEEQLYSKLPTYIQERMETLLQYNHHKQIQGLYQLLKVLGSDSFYGELKNLIQLPITTETRSEKSIQKRFISHLQQFIRASGMQDEVHIKTQSSQQDGSIHLQQSIKSILLQMIGEPNIIGKANVEKFIHFIHGMQLQTIQESNHFLHSLLQLPGEKIGLNEDLFIHFEGKKDKKGEINPNYCRILFVLQLKNMKETMIDMTIQKRIVSFTVYNEQLYKEDQSKVDEMLLTEKLAEKQYILSSVSYKPLYDMKYRMKEGVYEPRKQDTEGIDFRI